MLILKAFISKGRRGMVVALSILTKLLTLFTALVVIPSISVHILVTSRIVAASSFLGLVVFSSFHVYCFFFQSLFNWLAARVCSVIFHTLSKETDVYIGKGLLMRRDSCCGGGAGKSRPRRVSGIA